MRTSLHEVSNLFIGEFFRRRLLYFKWVLFGRVDSFAFVFAVGMMGFVSSYQGGVCKKKLYV